METKKRSSGTSWKGLLVVAVVAIAIIVSIISYAFHGLRDSANQRQCLNNLRQLWSASMMYAQDYDGWMPIYRNSTDPDQEFNVLKGSPSPARLRSSLDKYVKHESTWFCPSAISAGRYTTATTNYQYSTYAFQFCKAGVLRSDGLDMANPGLKKRQIAAMVKLIGEPHKYILIQDDPFSVLWNREPGGPHRIGMTNCVYLDGHVRSYKSPGNF